MNSGRRSEYTCESNKELGSKFQGKSHYEKKAPAFEKRYLKKAGEYIGRNVVNT